MILYIIIKIDKPGFSFVSKDRVRFSIRQKALHVQSGKEHSTWLTRPRSIHSNKAGRRYFLWGNKRESSLKEVTYAYPNNCLFIYLISWNYCPRAKKVASQEFISNKDFVIHTMDLWQEKTDWQMSNYQWHKVLSFYLKKYHRKENKSDKFYSIRDVQFNLIQSFLEITHQKSIPF